MAIIKIASMNMFEIYFFNNNTHQIIIVSYDIIYYRVSTEFISFKIIFLSIIGSIKSVIITLKLKIKRLLNFDCTIFLIKEKRTVNPSNLFKEFVNI